METNLGPVVKQSAANYIRSEVNNAISQGGKNIIDNKKFNLDDGNNCYVSPSALINVDHSMKYMM